LHFPLPHQHHHGMPMQDLQNQSAKRLQNVFSCSVEDNLLNSHSTCPHCSTQESISRCFIAAIFHLVTPISKD
jgi:hypothetical protein